MIKKILMKIKNLTHECGLFILIVLFIYIAVMITRLNNSLEKANESINNLAKSSPTQNLDGVVSVSEMMDRVNFRHEFDNMQYRLEDIKEVLDVVEINTRGR